MKTVLVIAAHSDDEALGCAGTMAKHVDDGDEVHVIFMTDGVSSRSLISNEIIQRKSNAELAGGIIGVSSMINFDFPDNKMDSIPLLDIIRVIENDIQEIQPDIIYSHHVGDLNVDHQVTHKAVMTACRPQPNFCVKEIYAFEVLSSTEWQSYNVAPFLPNVFVDISVYIETKKKVLNVYLDEMRDSPHSRSVENIIRLCQLRGATIGCLYAEAFSAMRVLR